MKKDSMLVNQPAFSKDASFIVMVRPCVDLVFPYHMHPGFQLNFVIEGKGTRFVGDHSEEYQSGDLVLLGPNLPHYWTYDPQYKKKHGKGKAIIIHFEQDFAGNDFFRNPEVKPISVLLDKAFRGLKFKGNLKNDIIEILLSIEKSSSLNRMVGLINILAKTAQSNDYEFIAGPAFEDKKIPDMELKIKRITNFISHHFHDSELSLEKLANMAAMSPTSFSKYFKKQTGQNYIQLLTDLRLSEACKLMSTSDFSIVQIANRCGYNNLSNFNKLFKRKYKCTPKQFIGKIHISKNTSS